MAKGLFPDVLLSEKTKARLLFAGRALFHLYYQYSGLEAIEMHSFMIPMCFGLNEIGRVSKKQPLTVFRGDFGRLRPFALKARACSQTLGPLAARLPGLRLGLKI